MRMNDIVVGTHYYVEAGYQAKGRAEVLQTRVARGRGSRREPRNDGVRVRFLEGRDWRGESIKGREELVSSRNVLMTWHEHEAQVYERQELARRRARERDYLDRRYALALQAFYEKLGMSAVGSANPHLRSVHLSLEDLERICGITPEPMSDSASPE